MRLRGRRSKSYLSVHVVIFFFTPTSTEEEDEDDQTDDDVDDESFGPEEKLIHDLLPLQSEARSPSLSQTSSPNRRSFPSQQEQRELRPCE